MIPATFEYAAPSSLAEVIDLLQQHGDDAKLLAGGHSLLPLMKLRLSAPSMLIDLAGVPDLRYIREDGDTIAVGAMTPYVEVETSELVRRRVPLLAQAAGLVGDTQVRNRGTIGGAVAHADPAGDIPTVITALDGEVVARGPEGERVIAARDFFQHVFTSALGPDEVIAEIRVPIDENAAQHYQKFRRRAIDWAIVGVAVSLVRADGSISSAAVALTNVGPTPMRATATEEALRGQPPTEETIRSAAELAAEGLDPSADLHASSEYKKHLARVLTRRALATALSI
jgi:carbon-monoxide dehydrogenase medium subunit